MYRELFKRKSVRELAKPHIILGDMEINKKRAKKYKMSISLILNLLL
jgi:hypothetical protein